MYDLSHFADQFRLIKFLEEIICVKQKVTFVT